MKKFVVIGTLLLAAVLGWATLVNVYVVSGTPDICVNVFGPIDHYAEPSGADWGVTSVCAVPTWVHPNWPGLPPALWISSSSILEGDAALESWRKFEAVIKVPCVAYNLGVVTLDVNSDNSERVWFNGTLLGTDGEIEGPTDYGFDWAVVKQYPALQLVPGLNKFVFIVRNYNGKPGDDYKKNPTGLIFRVTGVNAFELPHVEWQPPVTNDSFVLQDGTTLPMKFKLYLQDGTLVTDMKEVYLSVLKGDCSNLVGTPLMTWHLGDGVQNLRFDCSEFYYIANFKTKDFQLDTGNKYRAVVYDSCTQERLSCIDFMVEGKGNRSDR